MKKADNKILFIVTGILVSIYLLWRLFFTIPFNHGWISLIFGILLYYCELITTLGTFDLMYKSITYKQNYDLVPLTDEEYPHVDVLIATHNEDVKLLYKTINACTFMEYPDKSKVHIYICDDTNRNEVRELAAHFGVGYLGLEHNTEAKSGNYNNAIKNTSSPYIATFDADMIPQRTFLLKTIPYFYMPFYKKEDGEWIKLSQEEAKMNQKVGFVQTPQGFYNTDLFQYNLYSEANIPNEQDFFSKEINLFRNSANATVYTGSNTVISREAIESIGLFPINTITEDYETGLKIQAKGYKTFSTSEVLACGITPNTLRGMINQRIRWARGVIQSTRNCRVPFNKGLSLAGNLSYFWGFSYWWSFFRRMVFILSPIMFALFDIQVVNCGFLDILLIWAPSYFFYALSMRRLSSKMRTQRWNQIIDTTLAPFLILPVFLETIGISQKKFKVTDKSGKKKKDHINILYALPNTILLVLSVLAMIRYTRGKYGSELVYSAFIIYWLVYNVISLIYAMYFLSGRKIMRNTDRIKVSETVSCIEPGFECSGRTIDLSEGGMSFDLDYYMFFPFDEEVSFEIATENYTARCKVEIRICEKMSDVGKYRYRCKIKEMDDANKRQYFQIIHDREIEVTNELNKWLTTVDGIILNAHKRIQVKEPEKRKNPRVSINQSILLDKAIQAFLVDFNYQYILLTDIKGTIEKEKIYSLMLDERFEMLVERDESITSTRKLFRIVNYKELVKDRSFIELITKFDGGENRACL